MPLKVLDGILCHFAFFSFPLRLSMLLHEQFDLHAQRRWGPVRELVVLKL